MYLRSSKFSYPFPCTSNNVKLDLLAYSENGLPYNHHISYNSSGKLLQKSFKIEGVSVAAVVDFLEKSEDEFVFGVEA